MTDSPTPLPLADAPAVRDDRPVTVRPVVTSAQPAMTPGAPGAPAEAKPKAARLTSLDAFRGAIMLLMASGGFGIMQVARAHPDSKFWQIVSTQFEHVPWVGGCLWDMIQPAFMFMVGVAVPYSVARRRELGDTTGQVYLHAAIRSLVLVLLGVYLASKGDKVKQTVWEFPNVLCQIGLGYFFVVLLCGRWRAVQLAAIAAILVGTWWLFHQHPVPPADFDYAKVGVKAEEGKKNTEIMTGEFAHWNKNTNFGADVDRKLLNWFPRELKELTSSEKKELEKETGGDKEKLAKREMELRQAKSRFEYNAGGYNTINFVPAIATMLIGLMTGEMLRRNYTPGRKTVTLLVAGLVCAVAGYAAGMMYVPIVKRIWTPSWALWSGGIVLWMLAAFYWVIDVRGYKRWAFPLVVVGMNSIVMYMLYQNLNTWTRTLLKTHVSQNIFAGDYGPITEHVALLGVYWLICWWLYRQKIFVKV